MFWNRKSQKTEPTKGNSLLLWGILFVWVYMASPVLAQHYAYVTNFGAGDVSIIDLATDTVIATVPVGAGPQGVAVNPAGTALYVANSFSNEFTVIDTETHSATTFPSGPFPVGIAVHPDGTRIYVANTDVSKTGKSSVWVLDRGTNTLIDEIYCGNGSIGVTVHPNGKAGYVTNIDDGTVAVFDTETHEVMDTIVLETDNPNETPSPVPVAVHPAGTYLYVANRVGPTLWAINTATHEFTARTFGHSHVGIAVNPEGTVLYLPDIDNGQGSTVAVVDTKTLELITTIEGLNAPLDVSVHPDGTRLYITNNGNDTVSVVDTATFALVATIAVGSRQNAYGECIGPGVPYLLKEDAVTRLEATKTMIAGGIEGVVSPGLALEFIDEAITSGNLCLQKDLWSTIPSGDVDPRRLHPSQGCEVFAAAESTVKAVLDTIRRGWIMNAELRSELLAITDAIVRADRVIAAVSIDDAMVSGTDTEAIEKAQMLLKNGDVHLKEANAWEEMDKKAVLLTNTISEYEGAWQAAMDL